MVQAALAAIPGIFPGQSRREASRPEISSSLPVLAAAEKKKLKRLEKVAREERMYQLLMQPEVMGFIMAFGGFFLANNIPFSRDQLTNDSLQAIASTMSVAMGMGYAGCGDLTSLSVAMMAGTGSFAGNVLSDILSGTGDLGNFFNPLRPLGNWLGSL